MEHRMTVRLPDELHEQMRRIKFESGDKLSLNEIVVNALKEYLKNLES